MRKSRILTFLIAFSSMSMAACVYNNGIPMVVKSEIKVTLDESSLELKPGDGGKTFTPTVSSEEVDIKNNKVSIKANNNNVKLDADQIESGKQVRVKGVKVGKSTITVTSLQDRNAKATLNVEVVEGGAVVVEVTGLNVESNTVDLKVGETMQLVDKGSDTDETLYYEVLPEEATNKDVDFSVDKSDIATVSDAGLITAVKKGEAKVTVRPKAKNFPQEITVNVTEDEALTLNAIYLVGKGDKYGNWKPIKANEFKLNPMNEQEYMITIEGKKDDEFKAKKYTDPDSESNWFNIDPSTSGDFEHNVAISESNLKLLIDGTFTIYLSKEPKTGHLYKYWVGVAS